MMLNRGDGGDDVETKVMVTSQTAEGVPQSKEGPHKNSVLPVGFIGARRSRHIATSYRRNQPHNDLDWRAYSHIQWLICSVCM